MNKTFACPNCKQKLTATPEMAGVLVDCPACGQKIQIPAFEEPVPAQNAVQPVPPQYPPQQTQPYQQPYAQPPQYAPQQMQPYQQSYAPPPQPPQYQQPYAPQQQMQPYQQPYAPPQQYIQPCQQPYGQPQGKSWLVTLLLCFFLGVFGAHRFYVGKIGSGVAQLLTGGIFGIWTFVDFVLILCGTFTDAEGRPLERN